MLDLSIQHRLYFHSSNQHAQLNFARDAPATDAIAAAAGASAAGRDRRVRDEAQQVEELAGGERVTRRVTTGGWLPINTQYLP